MALSRPDMDPPIKQKDVSDEYRDGWDRIFGKRRCPDCGMRGCYEVEDGEMYCQTPGCPHAARRKAEDKKASEDNARIMAPLKGKK